MIINRDIYFRFEPKGISTFSKRRLVKYLIELVFLQIDISLKYQFGLIIIPKDTDIITEMAYIRYEKRRVIKLLRIK